MEEVLCEVIRRCESAPVATDLPQCQEVQPAVDSDEEGYCKFIADLTVQISLEEGCAEQHEQQQFTPGAGCSKRLNAKVTTELSE